MCSQPSERKDMSVKWGLKAQHKGQLLAGQASKVQGLPALENAKPIGFNAYKDMHSMSDIIAK